MVPFSELTLTDLTLADLTLEERAELERAVDGPITAPMIADKLAARGGASTAKDSPAALHRRVAWAAADLAFYRAQLISLEHEIAALMADRDGLYAQEHDRRTRHIAALNRQRQSLMEHCRPYAVIVADARRKLATEATCTPSASPPARSGG